MYLAEATRALNAKTAQLATVVDGRETPTFTLLTAEYSSRRGPLIAALRIHAERHGPLLETGLENIRVRYFPVLSQFLDAGADPDAPLGFAYRGTEIVAQLRPLDFAVLVMDVELAELLLDAGATRLFLRTGAFPRTSWTVGIAPEDQEEFRADLLRAFETAQLHERFAPGRPGYYDVRADVYGRLTQQAAERTRRICQSVTEDLPAEELRGLLRDLGLTLPGSPTKREACATLMTFLGN